jgi:RadC-like JAB domain-containing protein
VIAYHEVSRGTLDATLVHPREVFKAALLWNSSSIILTHYVARYIMQSIFCPAARRQDGRIETRRSSPRRWTKNGLD